MVGEARRSTVPLMPTPVFNPSDQPSPGLWHVAQDTVPLPDKRGSKNSALPNSTLAGVMGLSTASGTLPSAQTLSPALGAGTLCAVLATGPALAAPAAMTRVATASPRTYRIGFATIAVWCIWKIIWINPLLIVTLRLAPGSAGV